MSSAATPSMPVDVIFNEPAEDQSWESRGWYDYAQGGNTLPLVADGAIPSSTSSIQYAWAQSATTPTNTGGMRKLIPDADNVYFSFYIKVSSNWVGSGESFHPHIFQFLTNKNGAYTGPNSAPVAIQVELDVFTLRLSFTNVNNPYGVYSFADTDMLPDTWHKIETFIRLNTMVGTVGQSDGIMRGWLDGSLVVDDTDRLIRTGSGNEDMLFNQALIVPYIGSGSPITQTMWIDDLTIGTEKPNAGGTTPNPPSSFSVN